MAMPSFDRSLGRRTVAVPEVYAHPAAGPGVRDIATTRNCWDDPNYMRRAVAPADRAARQARLAALCAKVDAMGPVMPTEGEKPFPAKEVVGG